jgi:hypothetical protein
MTIAWNKKNRNGVSLDWRIPAVLVQMLLKVCMCVCGGQGGTCRSRRSSQTLQDALLSDIGI